MKKINKMSVVLLAITGALMLLMLGACSQPQQSSSSSDEKKLEAAEETVVKLEPFYALFIGNDSRYQTIEDEEGTIKDDDPSFGDTLMLARIDPVDLKVSLLSIPRDTYCVVNGSPDKINANHQEGPEKMVKAVEELTGVHVSYYFDEHFVDFGKMIDDLGGVSVDVPMTIEWTDILKGDDVEVTAGEDQHLNSSEALVFVRARKVYEEFGDACRQNNARELVSKAIKMVAGDSPSNASKYADILMDVCDTNIDKATLTNIIEQFMGHASEIQFQLGTGPFMDSTSDATGGILAIPREEEVYATLVGMMENGGDMTTVVPLQVMY